MCEHHRLGSLEMCVSRQVPACLDRLIGSGEQNALEVDNKSHDLAKLTAGNEAYVGRDLVVAAPTGVHLGSGGRQLGDPPLDCGVNVLVARNELEAFFCDFGFDLVECRKYRVAFRS